MEQPNNTHDGEAQLTAGFWGVLLLGAFGTGLLGVAMLSLLHLVQRIAYGQGDAVVQIMHASPIRILAFLIGGGLFVGVGWWALRRWVPGSSDVDDAVWAGTGDLALRRSLATASLSEVAVGVGGSLGQEAAPKLLGAALCSRLSRACRLSDAQRRLLVACGAGAGMGAVYNCPLAGALITAEVLIGSLTLPVVLPALVCSIVATVTTWTFLPNQSQYDVAPNLRATTSLTLFALVIGPLLGLCGVLLVRGVAWVTHKQCRSAFAPAVAFAVLGGCAAMWPELLGNGRAITEIGFEHPAGTALGMLLALALLKPAVTLLCLGSGASGGLFTPVLATGAALGLLTGQIWSEAWPGGPVTAYALVGAAGLSGAAMQAPLTSVLFVTELTGASEHLLIPLLLATALATLVARYVDGYSVYSARLPAL